MLESYLRPIYQYFLLDPLARFAKRIPPNQITAFACITGILVAPALAAHWYFLATLLLLTSGFFDTLDGTVARLNRLTSDLGCIFDILSDRIVEFAIIFGLFTVDPTHRGWSVLLMLGSCYLCITAFLLAGIFTRNQGEQSFHYSPGLIERMEAFIFFALMIWFPSHFGLLAIIFSGLVFWTSAMHLKQLIKHKKDEQLACEMPGYSNAQ